MANKSCFKPELSEAKVDASVEELLILEFLINHTIIVLGLAGYELTITISALRASLVFYHLL